MRMNTKSNKGFTLVEIAFVMFVIGILAAIALPNFISARNKARVAAAKDNLNTILKAINMYYAEYGNYPTQASMDNSVDIAVLQEELASPNDYLRQFYDGKIQEYKVPPVTVGDSSPFEILIRTKAAPNNDGKICWLYYSEERDLIEVWVAP